jgi:putative aminopeptidase FrvX
MNSEKENYFKILKDLVKIPSPSGMEEELARHIVNTYNVNDWEGQMDKVHNILFCPPGDNQSEKLPLLYAHLDTSKRSQPTDESLRHEDIIRLDEAGQVAKRNDVDIQMGFDDKAGVAAILYLMKYTDLKFRALFVVEEEKGFNLPTKYGRNGGGGIEFVIQNEVLGWVFEKSSYVLSLDRRNGNEIITSYGGDGGRDHIDLCSEAFTEWVINCSQEANYSMAVKYSTNVADVYNIKRAFNELNCVNLSIGYYCEHNNCEYLKIDETLGVIKVLQKLLAGNPQG